MKYIKTYCDGMQKELTREEAKELLSRNYAENVATYDEMLDQENTYPCMSSVLEVVKD